VEQRLRNGADEGERVGQMEAGKIERLQELFDQYSRGRLSRREFVRMSVAVGGVVAVQALLAACGGEDEDDSDSTPAPPGAQNLTPSAGQTQTSGGSGPAPQKLVYAGGQDAPTIDPSDRTDYSISALSNQLYDRLFRYEGGWPQPIEPNLCTEYEGSPDGREWTFTLTDKAVFHDGSPVTAEAVKYSIDRTLRMQRPRANSLLPIMDESSTTTPDEHTVKITLNKPYAELPRILSQPIMNPKIVRDNEVGGDEGAAWLVDHEAGSGPFTIKSWTVGTSYDLEAVPDYWQGWPGESHLSEFSWRIMRENTSQRIALISKEIDIADTISADDLSAIDGESHLHSAVNYGILAGYTKLNNQIEPTNNVDFRKFLGYAFDYEAFKAVLAGYAEIMTGFVPSGVPYYDASAGGFTTDLDRAREFLDKTPWKDGGITLDYVYVTGLSFEEQLGQVWLSQLDRFNIKVNMIPKVWPDLVAGCVEPSSGSHMNMIFTGYTVPDSWYFYQWYSPNWDRSTGGDFNTCSFFEDAHFNELVEQVQATTDEAEKEQIYSELQQILVEQAPEIPIYVQPNILGFSNRVQGYNYFGAISVDFWRLWIDDSKINEKP
jgi:peptide/nickel transport system substrate-binding protein